MYSILISLLFQAGTILPADFPGSDLTPTPPPTLVWQLDQDGIGKLHMVVHPEWPLEVYKDWLPQTVPAPVSIQPGDVLQIEWQRKVDLFRPTKVRLWLDDAIYKNFVAADLTVTGAAVQGNLQTFTTNVGAIPPFAADKIGPHTLALTWYDAAASGSSTTESKREDVSLPIVIEFTGPPHPGTGFRIITIKIAEARDGTKTLLSYTVEEKK